MRSSIYPSSSEASGVQFLVDSAADMTVLHPQDSLRLFPKPSDWAAIQSHPTRTVGGAGHGLPHRLVDALIVFTHEDDTMDSEPVTVWIAPPNDQNVQQESLLGRDVLASFVTRFDHLTTFTLDR
jgi:hypothetical protein